MIQNVQNIMLASLYHSLFYSSMLLTILFTNVVSYSNVRCRPHNASGCYQTGYVTNGVMHTQYSGPCVNRRPSYTGFTVYVKVHSSNNAQIFIDSETSGHVRQLNPYFSVTPRFGVIVANGYNNLIDAWNFYINE